jgi:glutathione S-transferase
VIDAAVHTIIIRKVTAPVLFDETPVGLRRRRTMAEGMARLEAAAAASPMAPDGIPRLDSICAVTAIDYLDFRFTDAPWLPAMPALRALSQRLRSRPSFGKTMPFVAA